MVARAELLAEAREWLATPYRHRCALKGYGADCVGLIAGLWRHFAGPPPWRLPIYGPDWAEAGPEDLRDALEAHFHAVQLDRAKAGDVIAFRLAPQAPCRHVALFLGTEGEPRILHAYWGRAVVESRYTPAWQCRAAAAFAFPFLTD